MKEKKSNLEKPPPTMVAMASVMARLLRRRRRRLTLTRAGAVGRQTIRQRVPKSQAREAEAHLV